MTRDRNIRFYVFVNALVKYFYKLCKFCSTFVYQDRLSSHKNVVLTHAQSTSQDFISGTHLKFSNPT